MAHQAYRVRVSHTVQPLWFMLTTPHPQSGRVYGHLVASMATHWQRWQATQRDRVPAGTRHICSRGDAARQVIYRFGTARHVLGLS